MLKKTVLFILLAFVVNILLFGQQARIPMQETVENSARYRWAKKEVLESRLLDDCENSQTWEFRPLPNGAKSNVNGEMQFTTERSIDGNQSVRLIGATEGDVPAPGNRPWGSVGVMRKVDNEDWSKWNRISVWIYPDLPGFKIVNAGVIFHGGGGGSGKDKGADYVILKNQQWNQVFCEIEYCNRGKVSGVEIQYRVQGNEAGATDMVQFDVDRLELQRVHADKVEGWDVAPGQIAYSHVGYSVGVSKTALANDLNAKVFKLVDKKTMETILTKPIKSINTPLGNFQEMDFSEVRKAGTYSIEAGDAKTKDFVIDNDVWESALLKSINFFYGQRCGFAVPGIHDVCHQDWMAGDMHINGGWHDAGDLSQGLINTSDATYAMFSLAERLEQDKPEIAAQLIDEANWGLDWIAKTTLNDGRRVKWAVMDFWTDNQPGTNDDAKSGFGRADYQFLAASMAEAIAARVLKNTDPIRAARSLKLAKEDWTYGLEALAESPENRMRAELPATAVNASFELYRTTGEQKYLDKALEIAPQITDAQVRTFLPGTQITGFFYDNPEMEEKVRSDWKGPRDINLMLALSGLVEFFPQHEDWMNWYSSIVLFSEYYVKNVAAYTEPYGMLPWRVCKENSGTHLSGDFYLRNFPTRTTFGQLHHTLALADALGVAGQARGNLGAIQLAERQIEWLIGKNPFSKSFMYGEGYDYHDYYNISGHIVGALPVGLPAKEGSDAPYWPPNALFAPTEVWVLPSLRLIHLLKEVAGPAIVEGESQSTVQFREIETGATISILPQPSGKFRALVPAGKYVVTTEDFENNMVLLPGAKHNFNSALDFLVSSVSDDQGNVTIELMAKGKGAHTFSIRTENLTLSDGSQNITLKPNKTKTIFWKGKVTSLAGPWLAVVIPDGDVTQKKEIFAD